VFFEPELPECEVLARAGHVVMAHPGQGTANRCVFFGAQYLELIQPARPLAEDRREPFPRRIRGELSAAEKRDLSGEGSMLLASNRERGPEMNTSKHFTTTLGVAIHPVIG
jgi:hypothetical protein